MLHCANRQTVMDILKGQQCTNLISLFDPEDEDSMLLTYIPQGLNWHQKHCKSFKPHIL